MRHPATASTTPPSSVDTPTVLIWIAMAGFWIVASLVALDGIARALHRPAGCETLTAHECTALVEERR